VAAKVAPAMTILAKVASPLVWFLDISGRTALHLLGYREQAEHRVSDEEIRSLMAEAESAGVIEPGEREMIAGVMRLGDRPVRAVMTPRREVDMVDLSASPEDIRKTILASGHSRLPAYDGTEEEMVGIVQAKDLLNAYMRGEQPDVRTLVRPAPTIPDTADALDVLEIIRDSTVHIGLVHDEYGHFEGVVTNADILEAIAGAFRTEEGAPERQAIQRDDGSWLLSGSMPADEMAETLGIPLQQDRGYHTAAGFVLNHFGYLPAAGNSFVQLGWRFEVIDLDGRRIDKILATRVATGRRA
jgi:putative hemolysin